MARDPFAAPDELIRRVYAYVAYRIGSGPAAEDVVSEAIERGLRYRQSYDAKKGSPAAWLAGIASRVLVDHATKGRLQATVDVEDPHNYEDFSHAALRKLALQDAVATLDERSREIVALRYGGDLKAREIGEILGMTTNAVEVALSRALHRLRSTFEAGTDASEAARPVPASGG